MSRIKCDLLLLGHFNTAISCYLITVISTISYQTHNTQLPLTQQRKVYAFQISFGNVGTEKFSPPSESALSNQKRLPACIIYTVPCCTPSLKGNTEIGMGFTCRGYPQLKEIKTSFAMMIDCISSLLHSSWFLLIVQGSAPADSSTC